ncbi:uncharacterized protein BDR25DRAFT_324588 [Lindgomyces ingoldianus]|uniref:Uncharacterized protein n=1 Tax=Lindgomyces ingoldianus TaxID=673940 RepID=A0ACB6QZ20_9PLEO|nr:uncharacterized protein BDR25DRAFT_324588 [Lindgomyces ingoldianus]KAF2472095.1 hypothetical protein BDR25DRAFT_324588 [Lindgomyces ingoldianus]
MGSVPNNLTGGELEQLEAASMHTSCIHQAELSADGTCVFTSDYNRTLSVYRVPEEGEKDLLVPCSSLTSSEPIWAFTGYSSFNAANALSSLVLISTRNNFVSLHNALYSYSSSDTDGGPEAASSNSPLDISAKLLSYRNFNTKTEAVISPHSLLFTRSGTHFLAGTQDSIFLFDLHNSSGPIDEFRTHSKRDPQSYKGIVSSLSISCDSILAAGTWTRYVGLYEAEGSGNPITTISLPGGPSWNPGHRGNDNELAGGGISEVKWSPCGRYIYVAERDSDVLMFYDIRNLSLGLGYCKGRNALAKQKLGFGVWTAAAADEVFAREGGVEVLADNERENLGVRTVDHEIWAGGIDGVVRVWRDPHLRQGALEADQVLQVGEDPVVGTMVNENGTAMAVASGRRESVFPDEDAEGEGR